MKNILVKSMEEYYRYLLKRLDNADKYFKELSKEELINIYSSKEYVTLNEIVKELGEIEDIVIRYNIFDGVKLDS